MPIRRSRSQPRTPLVLALLVGVSWACGGGGDDGAPAEYETTPGPIVPQPPPERGLSAEGSVVITPTAGASASATLLTKVEGTTSIYDGRESGYNLVMTCGATVAVVEVSLYFAHASEILVVEWKSNRWTVNGRIAEVETSPPGSNDPGGGGDAGDSRDVGTGDAGDVDGSPAGDAGSSAPPSAPAFQTGVGLPAADQRRPVSVTLLQGGSRYRIRATIPWRASNAPATCQKLKPGTGTRGSGGGCGGGSSSGRRSSGGDWD